MPSIEPGRGDWRSHAERLWKSPASERQLQVNAVAVSRAELLAGGESRVSPPGGRLVVFFPDATLSDGAAEAESGGFFDDENCPAWDTWVFAGECAPESGEPLSYNSYLVCWVPPEWAERVGWGIAVNPEECIRWAADADTPLTRRLRAAGLLV